MKSDRMYGLTYCLRDAKHRVDYLVKVYETEKGIYFVVQLRIRFSLIGSKFMRPRKAFILSSSYE